MKKHITLFTIALGVATLFSACNNGKEAKTGEAEAEAVVDNAAVMYSVDSSKSKISWSGSKPGGTHTGTIAIADGSVSVTDRTMGAGKFTIDMKSITVTDLEAGNGKENLESHLMGTVEGKEGDFFNVNEFPTASFVITSIEGDQYNPTVKGNLTIKGKTNNIEFPATVSYPGETMFLKSKKFTLDRTLWDVNYGSKSIFDNLGDKFISDDMELQIEVYAEKS
ncbi:YceI family protein [Rasiella rasia]|uniref:YceI family protein n=1 Tax=Rasiella rasia TaxID=2744027 RepID=A0A6G6GS85_9FLAO|nr:YceI family protein [Rasiella rasia]QIE60571.1 YceI family protein [Rasiella rasia]